MNAEWKNCIVYTVWAKSFNFLRKQSKKKEHKKNTKKSQETQKRHKKLKIKFMKNVKVCQSSINDYGV